MSAQDRVARALAPEVEIAVQSFWGGEYAGRCESEIERIFAATLFLSMRLHQQWPVSACRATCQEEGAHAFLEPQYVIGAFRADFLFGFSESANDLLKCIVVECDGHDFHDKTKEQAARDKARDRYLSTQVGRVVRFAGSEIYRNPVKCILEAGDALAAANRLAR